LAHGASFLGKVGRDLVEQRNLENATAYIERDRVVGLWVVGVRSLNHGAIDRRIELHRLVREITSPQNLWRRSAERRGKPPGSKGNVNSCRLEL
jgi:hypothetical protein